MGRENDDISHCSNHHTCAHGVLGVLVPVVIEAVLNDEISVKIRYKEHEDKPTHIIPLERHNAETNGNVDNEEDPGQYQEAPLQPMRPQETRRLHECDIGS